MFVNRREILAALSYLSDGVSRHLPGNHIKVDNYHGELNTMNTYKLPLHNQFNFLCVHEWI